MAIHNADIARKLNEIADLLEIEAANPFRVRAYRNAARTVEGFSREVTAMVEAGEDLTEHPGIGEDLAHKIADLAERGTTELLDKLHKELPASLADLLALPGLGPKRVRALHEELGINGARELERAIRDGRVEALPGFGKKITARLLEAVTAHRAAPGRFKLATAAQYGDALVAYLREAPGIGEVIAAGSFRRMQETVGDIDILATARAGRPVIERFTAYGEVAEVLSQGTTRATVVLESGLQVDLRVVPEESYGAALHYFTGSKAHNIEIRRMAQAKGLKLNEYGVFRGDERVAGDTEDSVFAAVGLPYIEPELRENRGEIEAAKKGRLPDLVTLKDLRGDLHAHTKATDGHNTIREMAEAAKARGFAYLAITEHSRRLTVAHGLDAKRLARQGREIDRLNAEGLGIAILKGVEVDILENGRLDLPDSALEGLDLVIGAVHSKFDLPRARQTTRILKAMDHPLFTMLAHPTGRLIPVREPYDADMDRIVRHAAERGCFLELNAHPERLDLLDIHCQMAKAEGVAVSINSDAHSKAGFDNLRFGVGQARRGWLEAGDVLNTRPLGEVRKRLAAVRAT